ncbi:hypothetical protein DMH04_03670 [Kibdelosporangium aridum]|uniref:Uncharacterized protein n=1 Tax=Kibdelosporangium aridum TaxID=2030 RepID=A0A428ZR78_KIBAR|nr:hypothetical protein DMH04_03670 [Kibdelosporangium aridum]
MMTGHGEVADSPRARAIARGGLLISAMMAAPAALSAILIGFADRLAVGAEYGAFVEICAEVNGFPVAGRTWSSNRSCFACARPVSVAWPSMLQHRSLQEYFETVR